MALLTGKTAVITGGSTGIGFATAKRFVDEGAYVFITGRRQAELEVAVKELGDNVTGVQGDVSKPEDLDRLYAAVADSGRRIDVVFANAAILEAARIGEITEEAARLPTRRRLQGRGVHGAEGAAPAERRRLDHPQLHRTSRERRDGIGVYAAIKAALRSFARTWASELRDRKIRVNVVSPGATDTPGIEIPGPDVVPRTGRRGAVRGLPAQHRPDGSLRHPRRGRQRGVVPGVGPEQLHHRRRHPRRRRHQPDLSGGRAPAAAGQ